MPGLDLEPRIHGGALAAGLDPDRTIDFSVNVNPYGPPDGVVRAVREAPLDRYPDPTARAAREALAAASGVADPDRLVLGNGATELLWSLARVLAGPGRTALVVEPTFSEFTAAVRAAGGRILSARAEASDAFDLRMEAVADPALREGVDVVYLCDPNNPTGRPVGTAAVAALARRLPGVTIVRDESFLSLSERHAETADPLPGNVVRIRSLTKEHAIPGVRVGYLIGEPDLARRIEGSRPTWTTSASAQAAAIAACREGAFLARSRTRLLEDRRSLATGLTAIGLPPLPSVAPFLMVAVGDAAGVARRLLDRGILVREAASFGLPGFLRLAGRPAADRERLLSALPVALGGTS